jgi:hypothetical protein
VSRVALILCGNTPIRRIHAACRSALASSLPTPTVLILIGRPFGLMLQGSRGVDTMDDQPSSVQEPWWRGKARRHHVLLKFVIICVVVALVILALVVACEQQTRRHNCKQMFDAGLCCSR